MPQLGRPSDEAVGRPLLTHVLDTARRLQPARLCVVVGHGADAIRARMQLQGYRYSDNKPDLLVGTIVFLIVIRGAFRILKLGK